MHNGIEDKKLNKAGPKPILSEHQRTKNSCVSYSNEQVKAALEKIQSTQISKDSEDSSLFSICPTKKFSGSKLQSKSTTMKDKTEAMSEYETVMTSEDETFQHQGKDTKCCMELKTKNAQLQRDLESAEERYPKLMRDKVKLMRENARHMEENARLVEELAAAEERYQAERRLREELEDNLFIMPGNSQD